jgi:hypothetical protein
MGRFPNMGRCIISYQEVLSSLLKNVNRQADEAGPCIHSTNGQLLRTSVLTGRVCFGALWNLCLSLNRDSWVVEGKLYSWISLVQISLLSVILNTCFVSLVEFYVLLFYSPIFLEHMFAPIMGRFDEPNMGLPILGTVFHELLLLGYIILQMP